MKRVHLVKKVYSFSSCYSLINCDVRTIDIGRKRGDLIAFKT